MHEYHAIGHASNVRVKVALLGHCMPHTTQVHDTLNMPLSCSWLAFWNVGTACTARHINSMAQCSMGPSTHSTLVIQSVWIYLLCEQGLMTHLAARLLHPGAAQWHATCVHLSPHWPHAAPATSSNQRHEVGAFPPDWSLAGPAKCAWQVTTEKRRVRNW